MKQWLKRIFYTVEHVKNTKEENILRMLAPSFVGIILCMVCLAGSTWAWFTASVQTQPQTIKTANYSIAVMVNNQPISASTTMSAGQTYNVVLTASGTAPSGGYCIVGDGEKLFYTERILPGETLKFTLIPEKEAVYTFTSMWGSHEGESNISDGDIIGKEQADNIDELKNPEDSQNPPSMDENESQPIPPNDINATEQVDNSSEKPISSELQEMSIVYVVQDGDTLYSIADNYHITAEVLAAYNGIEGIDGLQIGQEIKIPSNISSTTSPSSE